MMLTIADALQLEVFRGATVVAGHRGVHRVVEWLHNMGVPDAANWLNGGELVMTTWINLPPTPEEQQAYLLSIIEVGAAGLCIAVGRYIPELPEYLFPVADTHDFPLIAVPYQARFVDIARAVNQSIAQRSVREALDIHQALTRLVLAGGDIPALAQTLARLVRQSVSIENDRFEAYASHNIADVDEARRYTQIHGRTDPRLVQALEQRGYLPQIRATLRPVHLPRMADVGLEMERILAPIVVQGEIYGFVWIIADERPLSELELMAIESGATIAALLLLRQEAVQREEASRRGDLLSSLMQSDAGGRIEVLTDQALRYGVDLRKPCRVLLLDPGEGSTPQAGAGAAGEEPLSRTYDRVQRVVLSGRDPQMPGVIVGQFAGQILALVQESDRLRPLLAHILRVIDPPGHRIWIGISGVHQTVPQANRFTLAYQEAREALHIARRLSGSGTVPGFASGGHPGTDPRLAWFDDLGYLHTLYRAGAGALDGNPHLPALRRLLQEQQADLFHTLEVYLDTGGNGVATADLLHIHRSTLNYRLERIREVCQTDLSSPAVRVNLQIALKLMRLFDLR